MEHEKCARAYQSSQVCAWEWQKSKYDGLSLPIFLNWYGGLYGACQCRKVCMDTLQHMCVDATARQTVVDLVPVEKEHPAPGVTSDY